MGLTITGAAAGAGTFATPELTVAQVYAGVLRQLGPSSPDAGDIVRIYQAITCAGQAASLWQGRSWWWREASATFDTTSSTGTYVLRTINSAAMEDLASIEKIIVDDNYSLTPCPGGRDVYDEYVTILDSTEGRPYQYALWGDLTIGLMPIPDDTYTMTVTYLKRQSEIASGSGNTLLIVPAEYQWGVYVQGATWLLRHDTADVAALTDCPEFARTMKSMAESDPTMGYDQARGYLLPADTKTVIITAGGLTAP